MKKFNLISEIRKLARAQRALAATKNREKLIKFNEIKINSAIVKNQINNEAKKRLDAALGLLKLKSSDESINL